VRIFIALPLLALGACNFENDAANDQVRVEYNQQKIESAAEEAARTTRDVASSVGNVAETTGRAIKNEVGDIDVDVDVRRDKAEPANSQ